jgi:hypothetical protein
VRWGGLEPTLLHDRDDSGVVDVEVDVVVMLLLGEMMMVVLVPRYYCNP